MKNINKEISVKIKRDIQTRAVLYKNQCFVLGYFLLTFFTVHVLAISPQECSWKLMGKNYIEKYEEHEKSDRVTEFVHA